MSHIKIVSSDKLTSSSLITDDSARFYGSVVIADGTNDATLTIYNNNAGSGQIVFQGRIAGPDWFYPFVFPMRNGIWCENGIYAKLAGTGAACIVYYADAWFPDDV